MGFGSKCSILNGQVVYIENSILKIGDMWLIPLNCVTYIYSTWIQEFIFFFAVFFPLSVMLFLNVHIHFTPATSVRCTYFYSTNHRQQLEETNSSHNGTKKFKIEVLTLFQSCWPFVVWISQPNNSCLDLSTPCWKEQAKKKKWETL